MARAKGKEVWSETALTERGTVKLCELVTEPAAAGVTGILIDSFLHVNEGSHCRMLLRGQDFMLS